jgi:hypothetical protein
MSSSKSLKTVLASGTLAFAEVINLARIKAHGRVPHWGHDLSNRTYATYAAVLRRILFHYRNEGTNVEVELDIEYVIEHEVLCVSHKISQGIQKDEDCVTNS